MGKNNGNDDLVYEKNRIYHWCPVGRKIPTGGPSVPVGNKACRVSTDGGPEGWDFAGTTEHQ